MNELLTLTKTELRSLYGINRFLHTKNKKEKNRYRLLLGAWVFLILVVFSYIGALIFGLHALGLADLIPSYLTLLSSLLVFAVAFFEAGHRIFATKGYDLLISLPIKPRSIVISRFLTLYLESLLLTLAVQIPGLTVYAVLQTPSPSFYLFALPGLLLLPAIPLVAATVIGTLIAAIASRVKQKNLIQSLLILAFVVAVLLAPLLMPGMQAEPSLEDLSTLARTVSALIGRFYPPALLFSNALMGNLFSATAFGLLSAGALLLCITLAVWLFSPILRGMQRVSAKHNYQHKATDCRSPLHALCLREAKRYFSSTVYVSNTIVGSVMGAIAAIVLFFVGVDQITAALPIPINPAELLPFLISAIFCMMPISATAISMEGRQIQIIKSLPIPIKAWLDGKILFNLLVQFPFCLVAQLFLILACRPSLLDLIWIILIPPTLILFTTIFGITVNLHLRDFEWEKEEQVVKQSMAALVGGFPGMFLALILAGVILLTPAPIRHLVRLLITAILLLIAALLYRKNQKIKIEAL